ncbi:MAG: hydroxylamine oxidoreductase [Deltaproteobacteria bacterium]|jgi:hypothetical protein|nr:hydroxylamine oxidoreductase [Deltaproteobacteria bacterium]MBW2533526.1 hydroxylamine oxidoreductase [Deltaproteobacteria bacterium]
MTATTQRRLLVVLAVALCGALAAVHYRETVERGRRAGRLVVDPSVPTASRECVACHAEDHPGVVEPWRRSAHAREGVACLDCHQAEPLDPDGYEHYGERIATVVTPRDCASCHPVEAEQYARSRHAGAAEPRDSTEFALVREALSREGGPNRGFAADEPVVVSGCASCHGSTVALVGTGGQKITVDDLRPDAEGRPSRRELVGQIARNADGLVRLSRDSWPNTGVGRRNLDGSLGSCGACHGRHDFSVHRARQPASCGVCHRGDDQPQLEIFLASKHAAALGAAGPRATDGQLGRDPVAAPSCATCHLSGHSGNGWAPTHNPRERLSWRLRPVLASRRTASSAEEGDAGVAVVDTWQDKRARMREVCLHCHGAATFDGHYQRLDDLVAFVDAKLVAPGQRLVDQLREDRLLSPAAMDEPIEWSWFTLWHQQARRTRMAAAMISPDDAAGRGLAPMARTLQDLQRLAEDARSRSGPAGGEERRRVE